MRSTDTTHDTFTDRLVNTATIAIMEMEDDQINGSPGSWIRPMILEIQATSAAELIAHEQLAGRQLTLQDAVAFLLQGVAA